MVNNQIEFNEKYPKKEKIKDIEIKRNRNFQGGLIIEDYSELEKLNLRDIKSIEKMTLKNLPKLENCTIWNCGLKVLEIENCPQIRHSNVRRNNLTSLEFIKYLDNLEELEIEGNDKLTEILRPYKGDWKSYEKDFKELKEKFNQSNQSPDELLENIRDLKKNNKDLTEKLEFSQQKYSLLKGTLASLSKEIQKQILEEEITELDNKIKKTEIKTQELVALKTEELTGGTKTSLEKLKKFRKEKLVELHELKKKTQELEKALDEAKTRSEERAKRIEELSRLVSSVKQEKISVSQTLAYEKTLDFLRAKSIFLNARRGTIEELKERYNELSKFINDKNAKFTIIGNSISNIGGAASSTTPFGVIPKALGEIIKAGNEFSKIKFLAKSSEEFQILLKDEKELVELENACNNVSKVNILNLKDKQVYGKKHLFNEECEISAILESKGIWEGKLLGSEDMKTVIMLLSENLTKELEKEFNQQFEEFKNKLKFGKEYTELFIQEKEIRIKIQQLESQLEKLVNSAKNKLESKKWWDISEEKEKRTKERQLLFETFLNDRASLTTSDKKILERKLVKEGLDIISQKQKQLTELKTELESLQNQQSQIQIPSK